MPLLAEGGVQYTLRPAHAGMTASAPKNITTEIRSHWSQVGSLLFAVTTHDWAGGWAGNGNVATGRKYVWAVRDGDLLAVVVPVPAAGWLFLSGLGMLAGPTVLGGRSSRTN